MVWAAFGFEHVGRRTGLLRLQHFLQSGLVIAERDAAIERLAQFVDVRSDHTFIDEGFDRQEATIQIKSSNNCFHAIGQQGGFLRPPPRSSPRPRRR